MVKKNGKPKKRRVFTSDKHHSKIRQKSSTSSNPFDLHVNRLKHDVLGKRRNYEKGGQPLKSRTRAIEKVCVPFDYLRLLSFFSLEKTYTTQRTQFSF